MILRSLLCLGGFILVSAYAQTDDPPSKLPIDVPHGASVNFEADAAGKEIIPIVKHLMAGNMLDPSDPPPDKITVKTGLGNIDLRLEDLAPLLDHIKELHIVVYTEVKGEDPFKHHQHFFEAVGMRRLTFVPGENGVLIMRKHESTDRYGIVIRQKGSVVVLRTDGAPDVGDIGKVAFESLARAVQEAVKAKNHKGN